MSRYPEGEGPEDHDYSYCVECEGWFENRDGFAYGPSPGKYCQLDGYWHCHPCLKGMGMGNGEGLENDDE